MVSLKTALQSSFHVQAALQPKSFDKTHKFTNPFGVYFIMVSFFYCFVAVTPLEMNDQTDVTEFIFLGFSNHPNYRLCSSWFSWLFTWQLSWGTHS